MAIIQLIFQSTLGKGFESTAARIFRSGRQNNTKNRITGVLLMSGYNCIEILEGESELVRRTFCRIQSDQRHSITKFVKELEIDERIFTRWNIGYSRLDSIEKADSTLYDRYIFNGFDASIIRKHPCLAIDTLEQFSLEKSAVAPRMGHA